MTSALRHEIQALLTELPFALSVSVGSRTLMSEGPHMLFLTCSQHPLSKGQNCGGPAMCSQSLQGSLAMVMILVLELTVQGSS